MLPACCPRVRNLRRSREINLYLRQSVTVCLGNYLPSVAFSVAREIRGVWAKNGGFWAKIEKVGKECMFAGKGVISLGKENLKMPRGSCSVTAAGVRILTRIVVLITTLLFPVPSTFVSVGLSPCCISGRDLRVFGVLVLDALSESWCS